MKCKCLYFYSAGKNLMAVSHGMQIRFYWFNKLQIYCWLPRNRFACQLVGLLVKPISIYLFKLQKCTEPSCVFCKPSSSMTCIYQHRMRNKHMIATSKITFNSSDKSIEGISCSSFSSILIKSPITNRII